MSFPIPMAAGIFEKAVQIVRQVIFLLRARRRKKDVRSVVTRGASWLFIRGMEGFLGRIAMGMIRVRQGDENIL